MRYIQAMCYLLKFILVKLENSNNVVIRGFGRCKLSSKIKVRKNGKIILEDNVRVTEGCKLLSDGGKIIMQKAVEVLDGDTPETLQKRIMEQAEWKILPLSVEKVW